MSTLRDDRQIFRDSDAGTAPADGTASAKDTAPAPGIASANETAAAKPGARRFRADIQGLRAVAILLVVIYHAGVPVLRGGYVGVDVFFVISGYLITGQLVAEVMRSGRILLGRFYLKRVRRLLPSAVIVIIVSLLVARAFAPPLLTISLSVDGIFAALYTLNYRLAAEGVSYQNAGAAPSAFQHFWSLGVEEQFYLVWPLLIIAALLVSRNWWRDLLPVLFIAVFGVSLYISQYLLRADAPMSYFSVQSRAWEFAAGGLVALASGALAGVPSRIRAAMAIAGLAAIVLAGAVYNAATAFPGVLALVPVLGTVLIVSAGCGPRLRTEAILDNRVMQWLGQLSYPWYLWHWPVLVLAPYIWPHVTFTWPLNLGLMALSLIPAAATYYALELPVRRVRFNGAVWLTAGVGLMAAAVLTGRYVDMSQTGLLTASGASAPRPAAVPASSAARQAGDPFSSGRISGAVVPSILDAVSDTPAYPADCIAAYSATTSPECLIGQDGSAINGPAGSNRVVLLGDSHAGEWYPDVYGVAHRYGWDTEILNKEGCPLATITVADSASHGPYSQCDQWRANMIQRLQGEPRPKVIFIASLNYYTADSAYLANGWKTTLAALRAIGAPIVYLRDTPYPNYDVPTCVSGALSDWGRCSFRRSAAFHTDPLMLGSAASHGLAARVSVDNYLCPAAANGECPAVRGGVLLYRDNSHVTNTAMSMLLPVVRDQLRSVLKP